MPADRNTLERVAQQIYPGASVEHLGTGGFASTFKVRRGDVNLAVKVLDPDRSDPIRDEREVRALQRVDHPNVVAYRRYDDITVDEVVYRYLEMDYVAGESLRQILGRGDTIDMVDAAEVIGDVIAGAAAIWEAELVHRDLSPNNVMITGERAVIVDLGLARHLDLETVTVLPGPGTPGWMAPEQVASTPQRGDWRSDQFVIGLLAYRLLTGTEPYLERNLFDRWAAPDRHPLRPVQQVQPAVPDRLAGMVDRLLARQPFRRFLRPEDLTSAYDAALEELRGSGETPASTHAFEFYAIVGQVRNVFSDPTFCAALSPDGFILDAPNNATGDRVQQFGQTSRRMACALGVDPASFLDRSPHDARKSTYLSLPYGQTPQRTGPAPDEDARREYCQPIIDHQRASDANIVLAPYFVAQPNEAVWVDESLACARTTRDLLTESGHGDVPVWTTVAVTAAYLVGDALDDLQNRVTAAPPETLQLFVETAQPTFAPLGDPEVLTGLRELMNTCREARISVIAGRRYSSGLLLAALGAQGWSTGVSSVQQNFERHPEEPDDGRGGQPHPWMYIPQLLNSVTLETRALLLGRGGVADEVLAPSTPYAEEFFAGDPRRTSQDTEGRTLLRRHNLCAMRQQATALNGTPVGDRRRMVRQWVDAATGVYQQLGGPWNASEDSGSLTGWRAVL